MGIALRALSKIVVAQWAFAGSGNAVHMNHRISQDAVFSTVSRYGHQFFALPAPVALFVLAAFCGGVALLLDARLRVILRAR